MIRYGQERGRHLDTGDRHAPAERLVAIGATAALVTGGHGAEPVDHLFDRREHVRITVPRYPAARPAAPRPPHYQRDPTILSFL
jgi:hydroxymethylpyrimidine/phosphomethylpyrimidine kinase